MRGFKFVWMLVALLLVANGLFSSRAAAQYPAGGYDPIQGGLDAYRYHEARRVGELNQQLGLVNQMKWYSAWPAAGPALVGATWYGNTGYGNAGYGNAGYGGGGYYRDPPSLDYVYATGRRSAYGYGAWGRGLTPLYGGGYSRDIFSPWPYVPGDIWGYQGYDPVPQSIGQVEIQTGPNRWESHPVYPGTPAAKLSPPPATAYEPPPRRLEPPPVPGPTPGPAYRAPPREF